MRLLKWTSELETVSLVAQKTLNLKKAVLLNIFNDDFIFLIHKFYPHIQLKTTHTGKCYLNVLADIYNELN